MVDRQTDLLTDRQTPQIHAKKKSTIKLNTWIIFFYFLNRLLMPYEKRKAEVNKVCDVTVSVNTDCGRVVLLINILRRAQTEARVVKEVVVLDLTSL